MTAEYHLISDDHPKVSRAGTDGAGQVGDALARTIAEVLNCDQREARELVMLATQRSPMADRRLTLLARSVVRLARRLREAESGSRNLASRVDAHEKSLRMVCEILKQLDDPYGFGLSLDDRIGNDDPELSSSEDE